MAGPCVSGHGVICVPSVVRSGIRLSKGASFHWDKAHVDREHCLQLTSPRRPTQIDSETEIRARVGGGLHRHQWVCQFGFLDLEGHSSNVSSAHWGHSSVPSA